MAKKTKPIGVRFDNEKTALLKEKEGLETYQSVLNFLLDKYWWESKFHSNPVLERSKKPL